MSLVADYGDSSTSDSESNKSDSQQDSDSTSEPDKFHTTEKLPTPGFIETSAAASRLSTSVFANPFKEAEDAKQAILEKHVKMVDTQEHVQVINGKKICWNYRKGRCRFGHNCIYAHDSDLQKSSEQLKDENKVQQMVLFQNREHTKLPQESHDPKTKINKKRPGLTQGLVPSKKIMKIYREQHAKLVSSSMNKK